MAGGEVPDDGSKDDEARPSFAVENSAVPEEKKSRAGGGAAEGDGSAVVLPAEEEDSPKKKANPEAEGVPTPSLQIGGAVPEGEVLDYEVGGCLRRCCAEVEGVLSSPELPQSGGVQDIRLLAPARVGKRESKVVVFGHCGGAPIILSRVERSCP